MNRSSSFILYLFLISTIITLDQASKGWALLNLSSGDLTVSNWFNLSLSYNRGISWSLLNFQSNLGFYILTFIIAAIIFAFSFYSIIQHLNLIPIYFESFVVGGAISNIIDRLHHGVVIDFIDLHFGVWHWATFNIADVFIVVGILGVLLKNIKRKI